MKDLIKLRKEELQNLKKEKASLIESTNRKEEIRRERRDAETEMPERREPLVEDQGKHEEERAPNDNDDIRIEDLEVPKDQVDARPPVSSKAFYHVEHYLEQSLY